MSITNGLLELLAPVGNVECLKAAINSGADAVYLGMPRFNARENAENFSEEEFVRAIEMAHKHGVKVYLTVNTLVQNGEVDLFMQQVDKTYVAGVDAFIVQDLGVAYLLRKYYPEVDLHASTQMSICDVEGAKFAKKVGFKRIVLARELSVEEIAEIHEAVGDDVEIEVFVHGALCVSCSGQCLMSSFIGGRSGNRGKCAQTCRMRFALECDGERVDSGYLLSTKDIYGLEVLPELVKVGVTSFKIEGRMRKPEYVALTVQVYGKYLDLLRENSAVAYTVDIQDRVDLMQMFNRGGAHAGWLKSSKMQEISCSAKPKNWGIRLGVVEKSDKLAGNLVKIRLENSLCNGDGIEIMTGSNVHPGGVVSYIKKGKELVKKANAGDVVLVGDIQGNYKVGDAVYKTSSKELNRRVLLVEMPKKREISMSLRLKPGEKAQLIVSDEEQVNVAVTSEEVVSLATGAGVSIERIEKQLYKVSDYALSVKFCQVEVESDVPIFIAASQINAMRRTALDKYIAARDELKPQREKRYTPGDITYESKSYYEYPNLPYKAEDVLRLPCNEKADAILDEYVAQSIAQGVKCIELNNLAHLKYVKLYNNVAFVAAQGLNVFNDYTIKVLKDEGIHAIYPSMELYWNNCEINFSSEGVEIYNPPQGKPVVMTTKFCPVGKLKKCVGGATRCPYKSSKWELVDKKGERYEINLHPMRCGTEIMGFEEVEYE